MDETALLAANGRHHTQFVTGMVDVSAARLLDVVPGRSGTVLSEWIAAQPEPWREHITVVQQVLGLILNFVPIGGRRRRIF